MALSALLAWAYAGGGAAWLLGFVFLVPWLRALDGSRGLAGALLAGWAMSLAYTAAVFTWFGGAIGAYTQLGNASGLALLLVAAPLFQPQFLSLALVRHLVGRRHGRWLAGLAGAAAWVATESLLPRVLDDTLGYGLYPSLALRQAADLGGAAGLTVLLLLSNEAVSVAIVRRGQGVRAMARPLALAVLVPLLLAAYGTARLSALPAATGKPLRVALVQSNIVDYERLRRDRGAAAVVREVLDTHFAMSYDAVERQGADAVLWSETVYPTTFGQPKSEAGAELDREILAIVDAAGVPFVFGTYDRDAAGEYNAAAFVHPGTGLLGQYRKTRLFPLTEFVPAWLDSPTLRRWLPWTGRWQPGTGARVFPLRLADGREIPALPLICLDDMDSGLAIAGARLGARVILTMSNDSWFTPHARGAELHQAAAAFRSIETRLPQFRVTTNGRSGVIDAAGSVIAAGGVGQRVLVMGDLPVHEPAGTLMVAWGDWVGPAAAVALGLFGLVVLARAAARVVAGADARAAVVARDSGRPFAADVAVLPPAARIAAGLLRGFARLSLLGMAAAFLLGDGALQSNTLAQLRTFAALFLVPELAAWLLLRAFAARASIQNGRLVLAHGGRHIGLPVGDIVAIEPWRLPIPVTGAWLRLTGGRRWRHGLAGVDPAALAAALAAAGSVLASPPGLAASQAYTRAVQATQRRPGDRLRHPLAKFVLYPLLLAVPAFRMHQHIAYGSSFGEYQSFGLAAYFTTFTLWWAAWAMGVLLYAAVLRAAVEAGTWAVALARAEQTGVVRRRLDRLALAAFYLGLPVWLALRLLMS